MSPLLLELLSSRISKRSLKANQVIKTGTIDVVTVGANTVAKIMAPYS